MDPADKIEFRIHLENFVSCEVCRITKDRVGVVQAIRLTDTKERRLILAVSSEFCGGAIKVCVLHLYLCLRVFVCLCLCVSPCVCVCVFVYVYFVSVHYVLICVFVCAYMHTYMCVYMCTFY